MAIPDQDFAGGIVIVNLTEGTIGKVEVAASPKAHPLLRRRLARLAEKPLRCGVFERQITLAQAIPGLMVKTDFADPEGTGTLMLTATPKQRKHRVTAGFTSRGVDLLGVGHFDLGLAAYGAAIDGDQLSVAASASSDLRRFRYLSSGYAVPAAERLAIGGEAVGRAFDTAVLAGDRGIAGLAEVAWKPIGQGRLASSEIYAFGDAGSVDVRAGPGGDAQTFDLASAGLGVRARYRNKAELGLEAAQVVDRPFSTAMRRIGG